MLESQLQFIELQLTSDGGNVTPSIKITFNNEMGADVVQK